MSSIPNTQCKANEALFSGVQARSCTIFAPLALHCPFEGGLRRDGGGSPGAIHFRDIGSYFGVVNFTVCKADCAWIILLI